MANDTTYFLYVFIPLLVINVGMAYINTGFGQPATTNNLDVTNASNAIEGIQEDASGIGLGWLNAGRAVAGMVVWSFGLYPLWVEFPILILRILFIWLLIRLVRSGGG